MTDQLFLFLHIQTNTTGELDWENWFPEWNATTNVPGLPDTDAPRDSRDAKDSQVGACQLSHRLLAHGTF